MKLVIEKVGDGFLLDSPNRREWLPDFELPWVVPYADEKANGDRHEIIIELLRAVQELMGEDTRISIKKYEGVF